MSAVDAVVENTSSTTKGITLLNKVVYIISILRDAYRIYRVIIQYRKNEVLGQEVIKTGALILSRRAGETIAVAVVGSRAGPFGTLFAVWIGGKTATKITEECIRFIEAN